MRSLILSLFIVVSFNTVAADLTVNKLRTAHPAVTALAFDGTIDNETAAAMQNCINEAVADESGYELDESEVEEYCRPSNL